MFLIGVIWVKKRVVEVVFKVEICKLFLILWFKIIKVIWVG